MIESFRAMLTNVVDYAGLYPPASLSLDETVANYERYRVSRYAWMLNRLVLPIEKLQEVTIGDAWRITLLVAGEPGPLPRQVETLETKAGKRLSLPTYCEVPLKEMEDGYAKLRTAATSPEEVAEFLCGAVARRLPFKATAGLHHAMRSATMHGFVNFLVAATFAWLGMEQVELTELLNEPNFQNFDFQNDSLSWRNWRASTAEVAQARRDFVHSFGSCSFEEPLSDLRSLGVMQ